ncbi:hypothetical protein F5884DRAFT_764064 [Xylogone sp. PMI_703]|nr:hypothetical protein F5884DRAFT_764064 [Xylogone sp. PMI_703]
MATSAVQNPAVRSESKSAKKKKAKNEAPETSTPASPAVEAAAPTNGATESNSGDGGYESPYIKELYKNIRNINKKISNASKVDSIIAENPGKSLDDLVAERKINADQKAQALKIPSLKANLTQLEEQIAQYKKFDQEYKAKAQAEKAEIEKSLNERAAKELEEAVAAAKAEAVATAAQNQRKDLLLVSQFLRLAAIRRGDEEADANLDENKALEGLLARVYTGDDSAVTTMLKLIQGSDEQTASVTGEMLTTTYAEVKALSLAQAPPIYEATGETAEDTVIAEESYPVQTDPTVAHAGLTEIEVLPTSTTNETQEPSREQSPVPQNASIGDGANAAAEANWDNTNDLSASQEGWVEIPRDAVETETGITATPAAHANTQSWADDQPEHSAQHKPAPPANPNDGFHEVQRSRGGRDRGDGQFRGRGRGRGGDGYRGRGGYRGDGNGHRGRGGRGGPRGGGAPRGRSDDA